MRVETWDNSLAIRIPAEVAEALELKEGDEVEAQVVGTRAFEIARPVSAEQREAALARIKEYPGNCRRTGSSIATKLIRARFRSG